MKGIQNLCIRTLGPQGTNCEAAAYFWRQNAGYIDAEVVLYDTLETAVRYVVDTDRASVLLACVVYPYLHEIVFKNLSRLTLKECFVMPTHRMVLASMGRSEVTTVSSHPAPVNLLDGYGYRIDLVNSNAEAASTCAAGAADGCITTLAAAQRHGLTVIRDFGTVQMGFSIHAAPNLIL